MIEKKRDREAEGRRGKKKEKRRGNKKQRACKGYSRIYYIDIYSLFLDTSRPRGVKE